jgi:hypothetical protein
MPFHDRGFRFLCHFSGNPQQLIELHVFIDVEIPKNGPNSKIKEHVQCGEGPRVDISARIGMANEFE